MWKGWLQQPFTRHCRSLRVLSCLVVVANQLERLPLRGAPASSCVFNTEAAGLPVRPCHMGHVESVCRGSMERLFAPLSSLSCPSQPRLTLWGTSHLRSYGKGEGEGNERAPLTGCEGASMWDTPHSPFRAQSAVSVHFANGAP